MTTTPQSADDAAPALEIRRIGLVVHPRREIGTALDAARAWSEATGTGLFQVRLPDQERVVADAGEIDECDVVLALGGDGTTLHALHVAAAARRPVLGVACGSLGALTAIPAEHLTAALDRVARGDWSPQRLPGLRVSADDGIERVAINDVVVVRKGAGQVIVEVRVDGELYVRFAGDGIVVATPAGSSAYTLAAGGPILETTSNAIVVTPIANHGGCCPPLVTGPDSEVRLTIDAGYGGARLEFDGQIDDRQPAGMRAVRVEDYATLVGLGDAEPFLAGLRRRRILIDSPRVLARDERAAHGAD